MEQETKYHYECCNCGKIIQPEKINYLCPDCEKDNIPELPPKGVLKTIYNYDKLKQRENLFATLKENNFLDLLPINNPENFPKLRVGQTPLYKYDELEEEKLNFELILKDDSLNPTFSFKDRASYLVSAYAKENGIETIVAASTGNAGSSLAGICASQKQDAIIFVPAAAPKAKLTQIVMYGAKIVPVDGTYDNAFDLSIEATKKFGWYNRNTAYNPFTIEGKKTVSYEIFEQMKETSPDKVFVPVGDGVIISGVYKGFEDLYKLGLIEKMPTIVAVQAEGSSNIVNNLCDECFSSEPSKTVADSISVDIPRNFYMAKKFLQDYNGEWIKISDDEILEASKILSKNTGIFAEPAATASFAGMLKYKKETGFDEGEKALVLLTGSGLKDLNSVQKVIEIPAPVEADIKAVEEFLK